MNNSNVALYEDYSNVIPLSVINGKKKKGELDNTNSTKVGKSAEVYAFKTKEEIASMIKVLDKHIAEASNNNQRQIAHRNKLLFIVGMNIGIRASDLRTLRFSFFLNEDGSFKEFYTLQPIKQRKQKKFVKLFFNQTVKTAISNYIAEYPIESLDDYLFPSRKGDTSIEVQTIWQVIKDTAFEAGIRQNIGSHSLRKTFGFWVWHESKDKNKALVVLQNIFNHSSVQTTCKYIGLLDEEISDAFNSIDLGFDMI